MENDAPTVYRAILRAQFGLELADEQPEPSKTHAASVPGGLVEWVVNDDGLRAYAQLSSGDVHLLIDRHLYIHHLDVLSTLAVADSVDDLPQAQAALAERNAVVVRELHDAGLLQSQTVNTQLALQS